jgi:hypothetical protein
MSRIHSEFVACDPADCSTADEVWVREVPEEDDDDEDEGNDDGDGDGGEDDGSDGYSE